MGPPEGDRGGGEPVAHKGRSDDDCSASITFADYPDVAGQDREPYPNRVAVVTPMRHPDAPRHWVELLLAYLVTPCAGAEPFTVLYTKPESGPALQALGGWAGLTWPNTIPNQDLPPPTVTNELEGNCAAGRWSARETPRSSAGGRGA